MSEMEILRGHCERLKAEGLVDIKVTWAPDAPSKSAEQRAASLNRALEAIERGEFTEMLPLEDSRRVATDAAPCDHKQWAFRTHGRCCTCGVFMVDFGD